jgi:hypothetical protein
MVIAQAYLFRQGKWAKTLGALRVSLQAEFTVNLFTNSEDNRRALFNKRDPTGCSNEFRSLGIPFKISYIVPRSW